MLVKIYLVVVEESQTNLFDIPVHGSCPGIEGDHRVKVCGGDGGRFLPVPGDIVIGGSPHPKAREDLTPEWLTEVAIVGASQSFELFGGEVGVLHGGVLSGVILVCDVTIA
jgi:hypothetical protein